MSKKMTVKQALKKLPKDLGTVQQIVRLAKRGYSKKELIEDGGFNKNTVYRQVREQVTMA